MNVDPRGELQRVEEANRLYWHTDLGVNQIAEEMGLSKGALYNLVAPLPSGVACPDCAAELVHPNRTARDKGFLTCPSCGFEEERSVLEGRGEGSPRRAAVPPRPDGPAGGGGAVDPGEGKGGEAAPGPRLRLTRDSARLVLGSGLVGMAVGILLSRWLRRD